MSRKLIAVLITSALLLFGCGDDDDDDNPMGPGGEDNCTVTITNGIQGQGTSWDIVEIHITLETESTWGDNLLSEVLQLGESWSQDFEPGDYDLMIVDEDYDTYTRWGVELDSDDYDWTVTLDDIDSYMNCYD